ncbi:hypothetical protein BLA29_001766 [Euroglyphus maynei]|uniref:Uncharacterized protein n=1 Tax=Euroglyphus maynei TaxID=6958 RepID=A0A1Y3B8S5_EURMA|nr:hypothetical protein BLA29_001766 [Euroglyphus maynei]
MNILSSQEHWLGYPDQMAIAIQSIVCMIFNPYFVILLTGTVGMFIILAICVAYCLLKSESSDENPDNRILIQETFEQIYDFYRRRAYQQALLEYQFRYELSQKQQQQQQTLKENDYVDTKHGHKRKKQIKKPELDPWIRKQMAEAKMDLIWDNNKRPVIKIGKPKLGRYVQSFIGDVTSTVMRRQPNRPRPVITPVRPINQISSVASDNQQSSMAYDEDIEQQFRENDQKSMHYNF